MQRIWKTGGTLFATFLIMAMMAFLVPLAPRAEAATNRQLAFSLAEELQRQFSPEVVRVTLDDSKALVYAELEGARISKIRIDKLKLEARLKEGSLETITSDDPKALASQIISSRGEMVLLEKDVNDYFDKNTSGGFSKLKFEFSPQGFKVSGIYEVPFLFKIRIRLNATGILVLQPDGVYLDKVNIFVENVKQPEAFTEKLVSSVNPLLDFKEIPFPVHFESLKMSTTDVTLTGNPLKLVRGETVVLRGNGNSGSNN